MKVINRGAEAVLYIGSLNGEIVLVKERVSKGYRIKALDSLLRKERTRREVSLLSMARRSGINTPKVMDYSDDKIYMERLNLKTAKSFLDSGENSLEAISESIGEIIAKLHSSGIVHGDLTTSNMLTDGREVFLIDFSLGKVSKKIEDQATDLYLLYEALFSTHHKLAEGLWRNILNTYIQRYTSGKEVLKRLEQIKKRRRYKTES